MKNGKWPYDCMLTLSSVKCCENDCLMNSTMPLIKINSTKMSLGICYIYWYWLCSSSRTTRRMLNIMSPLRGKKAIKAIKHEKHAWSQQIMSIWVGFAPLCGSSWCPESKGWAKAAQLGIHVGFLLSTPLHSLLNSCPVLQHLCSLSCLLLLSAVCSFCANTEHLLHLLSC